MNTLLSKPSVIVILILLYFPFLLSCSSAHVINIDHQSDVVKIKDKAELELARSIWKKKSIVTYQVSYERGSFTGVRMWKINVKNKKFSSGVFHRVGEEKLMRVSMEEGEHLTIDAMLDFSIEKFDEPGYSFYKSSKNDMLIGYSYSSPDPGIEDLWGGINMIKVSF